MAEKKKETPLLVLRADLKAKDVTAFELERLQVGHDYILDESSFSNRMVALKCAIGVGWIEDPDCKKVQRVIDGKREISYVFGGIDVDDMQPALCYKLGGLVNAFKREMMALDPNS